MYVESICCHKNHEEQSSLVKYHVYLFGRPVAILFGDYDQVAIGNVVYNKSNFQNFASNLNGCNFLCMRDIELSLPTNILKTRSTFNFFKIRFYCGMTHIFFEKVG